MGYLPINELPSCSNCGQVEPVTQSFFRKLWNAFFFCNDCGRMMRITAIIVAAVMTLVGWFY